MAQAQEVNKVNPWCHVAGELDTGGAHPAVQLVQAAHVQRARLPGVLAVAASVRPAPVHTTRYFYRVVNIQETEKSSQENKKSLKKFLKEGTRFKRITQNVKQKSE